MENRLKNTSETDEKLESSARSALESRGGGLLTESVRHELGSVRKCAELCHRLRLMASTK